MSNKMTQVDWDDDGFLDIDECRAKVRQLRIECKESDDYLQWLHRILREDGYILSANEDGIPVLARNPLRKLKREKAEMEQRAERAEARAQLMTPELTSLLDDLAAGCDHSAWLAAERGWAMAARIREALAQEASSES